MHAEAASLRWSAPSATHVCTQIAARAPAKLVGHGRCARAAVRGLRLRPEHALACAHARARRCEPRCRAGRCGARARRDLHRREGGGRGRDGLHWQGRRARIGASWLFDHRCRAQPRPRQRRAQVRGCQPRGGRRVRPGLARQLRAVWQGRRGRGDQLSGEPHGLEEGLVCDRLSGDAQLPRGGACRRCAPVCAAVGVLRQVGRARRPVRAAVPGARVRPAAPHTTRPRAPTRAATHTHTSAVSHGSTRRRTSRRSCARRTT